MIWRIRRLAVVSNMGSKLLHPEDHLYWKCEICTLSMAQAAGTLQPKSQNLDNRTIFRALKTTSTASIKKVAFIQTLDIRQQKKLSIQGEILCLKCHALHSKQQALTRNCLKRQNLNNQVKELQIRNDNILQENPTKCEPLNCSKWSPQCLGVEIKMSSLKHHLWNLGKKLMMVLQSAWCKCGQGGQMPYLSDIFYFELWLQRWSDQTLGNISGHSINISIYENIWSLGITQPSNNRKRWRNSACLGRGRGRMVVKKKNESFANYLLCSLFCNSKHFMYPIYITCITSQGYVQNSMYVCKIVKENHVWGKYLK